MSTQKVTPKLEPDVNTKGKSVSNKQVVVSKDNLTGEKVSANDVQTKKTVTPVKKVTNSVKNTNTEDVGSVEVYGYNNYIDGLTAEGAFLTIPYTKETDGKYKDIALDTYNDQMKKVYLQAHPSELSDQIKNINISYININGQPITDVNPNNLIDISKSTPIFAMITSNDLPEDANIADSVSLVR